MSTRVVIKPGGVVLVCILVAGAATILGTVRKQTLPVAGAKEPLPVASAMTAPLIAGTGTPLLKAHITGEDPTAQWNIISSVPDAVGKNPDGVVRVVLTPASPAKMWSNMMIQNIEAPLKKGDRILFRGFLRSSESRMTNIFVEQAVSPHTKNLTCDAKLTTEWREFQSQGTVLQDFLPNEARIVVHLGAGGGFVEIKDFQVELAPASKM